MSVRLISGFAAATAVAAIFVSPAAAQETYRTHSCGPPPLSVGVAVAGGEVLASAGEDAIKGMPAAQVTAGAQVARTAYAGMRNQAMSTVLSWYQCRMEHNIRVDGGANAEARVRGLQDSMFEIEAQLAVAQGYSNGSAADFQGYINSLSAVERPSGAFTLTGAQFDQYFANVNPSQTWLQSTTISGWVTGGASGVKITACGGIVRAALSDGGSSIQASIAGIQAGLKNYFDAARQPRIGLLQLVRGYAGNPVALTPAETNTFQGCAAALLQDAAVQPSGTNLGPAVRSQNPAQSPGSPQVPGQGATVPPTPSPATEIKP